MNSKSKGNSFERYISKQLSLWWSNGEKDDLFWRSQNSGGRWTSRNKQGIKTSGQSSDIQSTSSESELFTDLFSIECKSYKYIDLWNIIEENGNIMKWLSDLYYICREEKKNPLLIIKSNYKPTIMITNHLMKNLLAGCEIDYKLRMILTTDILYLYMFDDLLKSDIFIFKDQLQNNRIND